PLAVPINRRRRRSRSDAVRYKGGEGRRLGRGAVEGVGSVARLEVLSPADRLAAIRRIAARTFESHLDWEAGLRSIYHLIHDIDAAQIDRAEVQQAAPDLMRELFAIRTGLRDRIAAWQEKGILLRPAETALRDVFRIARYASDMLGEIASGNARLARGEKSRR